MLSAAPIIYISSNYFDKFGNVRETHISNLDSLPDPDASQIRRRRVNVSEGTIIVDADPQYSAHMTDLCFFDATTIFREIWTGF